MPKLRRNDQAIEYIKQRDHFSSSTGNFVGYPVPRVLLSLGDLPEEGQQQLLADYAKWAKEDDMLYVVYSYVTPIAWVRGDELVMPNIRYSGTTTKHQGIVRRAGGKSIDCGDPGQVRRGKGHTPYGPQGWGGPQISMERNK